MLKIATGLAFGIVGAVCSITALQRHRRVRRAWERCRGTRPSTQEEAEALARQTDITFDYDRRTCAFEGHARSIAYTN